MSRYISILFLVSLFFLSCSTLDIPSIEESTKRIERINAQLTITDNIINATSLRFTPISHITVNIKQSALNYFIQSIANSRSDDLRVLFHKTNHLISETKSLFGLTYTNYIDIDTGSFTINIKDFHFTRFIGNRVDAVLTLEGKGRIHASGRYMGIPARTSPYVVLSMDEIISFNLNLLDGILQLRPVPKKAILKITMYITLLEWSIPWSKEYEIQIADLIPPFDLPSIIRGSIALPVPASDPNEMSVQYQDHPIELFHSIATFENDILTFRTNFDILK